MVIIILVCVQVVWVCGCDFLQKNEYVLNEPNCILKKGTMVNFMFVDAYPQLKKKNFTEDKNKTKKKIKTIFQILILLIGSQFSLCSHSL